MDSVLPKVLVALLVKQKEYVLDYFLETVLAWDYPKDRIHLYIRTNNNTDRTLEILSKFVDDHGHLYAGVTFDSQNLYQKIEKFDIHEWNSTRFTILGHLRQASLLETEKNDCDYYFVSDVDNFLLPHTLRTLVSRNVPIVAPLLQYALSQAEFPPPIGTWQEDHQFNVYSNFHLKADVNGYYLDVPQYYQVLRQEIKGIIEVDVVHCTYLVQAKYLPVLKYLDDSLRHEYVIFAESARRAGIKQFLDTTEIFGCLTLRENVEACKHYMRQLSAKRF